MSQVTEQISGPPQEVMRGEDHFPRTPEAVVDRITVPAQRRVLFHIVQEVRPKERLVYRFAISFVSHSEDDRNCKAGILTAHFLDVGLRILPPPDKMFRHSERYGYYTYVGLPVDPEGGVIGEFSGTFDVPLGAARAVLCLMPFSNPSIRLSHALVEVGPAAV